MEVITEVQSVTPKLAIEWLAASQGNRSMRHDAVANFASQMKRGEWMVNGEAITFDHSGRLVNGHHRLMAVVVADTTVKMMVTTGVDPSAIFTLDTGTNRSLADHLTLNAGQNSKTRASILAACVRVLCGFSVQIRTIEAYRMWEPMFHAGTEKFLEMGLNRKAYLRRATVAAPLVLAYKKDPEQVELCMAALRDGTDMLAGDPMLTLREYLMQVANGERARKDDTPDVLAAKVFAAVEARIEGRHLRKLQASFDSTESVRKLYLKGSGGQMVTEAREARNVSRQLAAKFEAGVSNIEDIKKLLGEIQQKKN